MANENKIVVLSDREQILLKPGMYCGSIAKGPKRLLLCVDDKFAHEERVYVEGLLKIIDEIVDNSIDEFIRTNGKFANNISIKIRPDHVMVCDNGRGLPQSLIDNRFGEELPQGVIAFTQARAGSNFRDDTKANGIGTNGVGSFLTNVMSKTFTVNTDNGDSLLSIKCSNNCENINWAITPRNTKKKPYTNITFYPDFSRFDADCLDEVYEDIIINRLSHIVQSYDINFSIDGINFKGDIKKIHPTNYLRKFHENIITCVSGKYMIGVYPSVDEFEFTSFVNGLYLKRGGSNIDYISKKIIEDLRLKLEKKYKTIKPGDIKNSLAFAVVMTDFNNLQFDSQTKETMTNSNADLRAYFDENDIKALSTKVMKDSAIVDKITYIYRIKEELAKKELLKQKDKTPKVVRHEKYTPAIKRNKYLVIVEGASAKNSINTILGRDDFGYIEIRGKTLNTLEKDNIKVAQNTEISLIRNVMGIKLSEMEEDPDYKYDNILIAADADLDGMHVSSLLFTFFLKYTKLFQLGRIKMLKTPIAIATKGKTKRIVMEFDDLTKFDNSWNINYKKGLGSWEEGSKGELGELGQIFEEFGLDTFIKDIKMDDEEIIVKWMSSETENVEFKKKQILENDFCLGRV